MANNVKSLFSNARNASRFLNRKRVGDKLFDIWVRQDQIVCNWKACRNYIRTLFSETNDKLANTTLACSLLSSAALFGGMDEEVVDGEKELIHTIVLAQLYFKDGNYKRAEQILQMALEYAKEKEIVAGITYIQDMLAGIAFRSGHLDRAEKLLVDVIERLTKERTPENDNSIVSFCLKLTRMYDAMQNDKMAEEGFKFCKKIQQKKMRRGAHDEETRVLWVTIVFWYGRHLLAKKRYDEAVENIEEAYQMARRLKGILPAQLMVLLHDLSEACLGKGDVDAAMRYLQTALVYGDSFNYKDLPMVYVKLGLVFMEKEMFARAKLSCMEGERLAQIGKHPTAETEAKKCLEKVQSFNFA